MRRLYFLFCFVILSFQLSAQQILKHTMRATRWVDSVYQSLTPDQRIAQLMIIRESSMDGHGRPVIYADSIRAYIRQFNIGGICIFQGDAPQQASLINEFQNMARTPLMVCIDGETGLGMRMEDVAKIPDQMTLGAMQHANKFVYKIGEVIGDQCRRAGINVNYAPVVDINNNPKNPVIGYRSFGQNKYIVASYGIAIMKGMQSKDIMACAKHFPGHGDVSVDSHLDLPVVNKPLASLDTLELYPFKKIFKAGIASVMIAHLSIPTIETTPHLASSLSPKFVTGLLKGQIGFKGISFTDALGMKGVAKYFPPGEVSVKSLEAGNDMLCLPTEIGLSIERIEAAIKDGKLNWTDLEKRIKKVLYAKYNLGLNHRVNTELNNITADLNKDIPQIRKEVARRSLTAVALQNNRFVPLSKTEKIAYIAFGTDTANTITTKLKADLNATIFHVSYQATDADAQQLQSELKKGNYDRILVGVHNYSKRPAHNFDMNDVSVNLIKQLGNTYPSATVIAFGNPYAIANMSDYKNIIACYEDDAIFQQNAFDFLSGKTRADGRLPVSVNDAMPYGTGLLVKAR